MKTPKNSKVSRRIDRKRNTAFEQLNEPATTAWVWASVILVQVIQGVIS